MTSNEVGVYKISEFSAIRHKRRLLVKVEEKELPEESMQRANELREFDGVFASSEERDGETKVFPIPQPTGNLSIGHALKVEVKEEKMDVDHGTDGNDGPDIGQQEHEEENADEYEETELHETEEEDDEDGEAEESDGSHFHVGSDDLDTFSSSSNEEENGPPKYKKRKYVRKQQTTNMARVATLRSSTRATPYRATSTPLSKFSSVMTDIEPSVDNFHQGTKAQSQTAGQLCSPSNSLLGNSSKQQQMEEGLDSTGQISESLGQSDVFLSYDEFDALDLHGKLGALYNMVTAQSIQFRKMQGSEPMTPMVRRRGRPRKPRPSYQPVPKFEPVAEDLSNLSGIEKTIYLSLKSMMPIDNQEEFMLLLEILKSENIFNLIAKNCFNKPLQYGRGFRIEIGSVLAALIGRNLACQIRWTGTNGKLGLESSTFFSLMITIAGRSPNKTNPSEKDVKDAITAWLNNASTRVKAGKTRK